MDYLMSVKSIMSFFGKYNKKYNPKSFFNYDDYDSYYDDYTKKKEVYYNCILRVYNRKYTINKILSFLKLIKIY